MIRRPRAAAAFPPLTRRSALQRIAAGFGLAALAPLLERDGLLAGEAAAGGFFAPRAPHFPAKARNVIFLFMSGAPSHMDLYDPKPELSRLDGQPMPPSFGEVKFEFGVEKNRLMGSKRTWKRHGACGMEISDWLPRIASCADDLCLLRGCVADSPNHAAGIYQMNTGSIQSGHPSLGAWSVYGLGSLSQDLPAYVVIPDGGWPKGGAPAWGAGYLPPAYGGTILRDGGAPLLYLDNPAGVDRAQQGRTVDFANRLNREHAAARPGAEALEARIAAYETAFRMQAAAPELLDLGKESPATLRLYDDGGKPQGFALRCLLARRMVERGVRFVQLYAGDTHGWDAHSGLERNHSTLCRRTDAAVAGLLADLKARGLLDTTLVIWAGEFGRTPHTEGKDGRDHNHVGFSIWMAGGGVKRGFVHGATDAIGLRAVAGITHVHDIHATILHLLGFDHERLTFRWKGRDMRLTDVHGRVIREILA